MGIFYILAFFVLFPVLLLAVLFYSVNKIKKIEPVTVYAIWYAYSLSFCIASVFLLFEEFTKGSSTVEGIQRYFKDFGKMYMKTSFELGTEVVIIIGIVYIIIAPQILSYIFSGIFGCSARPRYVKVVSKYAFWFFVKSTSALSGVLLALSAVGAFTNWKNNNNENLSIVALMASLLAIAMTFFLVFMFYYQQRLFQALMRATFLDNLVRKIDKFASRSNKNSTAV